VKYKVFNLLSEKLFDIVDLHIGATRHKSLEEKMEADENGIWSAYLDEMGFLKFVVSGWSRNEDLDGPSLEDFSLLDSSGRKVDPERIEENFTVVRDPLDKYRMVGIPKEIAVKASVLGQLPDSPSVQRMREGLFCSDQKRL
jgi:hypothetical protein